MAGGYLPRRAAAWWWRSGRGSSTTPPGHPSGTRQRAPARRQRVVDVARGRVAMDEPLSELAPREGGEDAVITGPCRLGVSGSVLRSRIMVRGGIAVMLQPQQLGRDARSRAPATPGPQAETVPPCVHQCAAARSEERRVGK